MALFMDVHNIDGPVTEGDVAIAHQADLAKQGEHDVHYVRYWVSPEQGKIFCLVEAPDAEAAAHGAPRGPRPRRRRDLPGLRRRIAVRTQTSSLCCSPVQPKSGPEIGQ